MIKLTALLPVILALTTISFAQSDDVKTVLGQEPLTAEQVAVYRGVLQLFSHSVKVLNVAKTTDWLDVGELRDSECLKSLGRFDFADAGPFVPTVHKLDPALAVAGRIALVDPEEQTTKVRQNDPDKTMREGKSVDDAVTDAFAHALFTLSEIEFDKGHHHAILSYSLYCGRLCGNGATIMMKKAGTQWKFAKRSCHQWVS